MIAAAVAALAGEAVRVIVLLEDREVQQVTDLDTGGAGLYSSPPLSSHAFCAAASAAPPFEAVRVIVLLVVWSVQHVTDRVATGLAGRGGLVVEPPLSVHALVAAAVAALAVAPRPMGVLRSR